MASWKPSDCYVAACYQVFSTHFEGIRHEKHCAVCQRVIRYGDDPQEIQEDETDLERRETDG